MVDTLVDDRSLASCRQIHTQQGAKPADKRIVRVTHRDRYEGPWSVRCRRPRAPKRRSVLDADAARRGYWASPTAQLARIQKTRPCEGFDHVYHVGVIVRRSGSRTRVEAMNDGIPYAGAGRIG